MHPVLFQIGSFQVTSFFALATLAFILASFLAARRARKAGLLPGQIWTLGAAALFSMVAGSRLGYVAIHTAYYRKHLGEILRIDSGGLALAGGLGLICVVIPLLLRWYKQPILSTIDRMIPPLVLAQAVIRIGCFLEGCCYGRLTNLPWGIVYPIETVRRHPTQLYEAFFLSALYVLLLRFERPPLDRRRLPGTNLLWYCLVYGLFRFAIGFLRVNGSPSLLGLKLSQWIGLPIGLAALFFLIRLRCTRSS